MLGLNAPSYKYWPCVPFPAWTAAALRGVAMLAPAAVLPVQLALCVMWRVVMYRLWAAELMGSMAVYLRHMRWAPLRRSAAQRHA